MAVYTHLDPETIDAFLEEYDIGRALAFHGIAEGVENSNYLLKTDQGQFILTIYEKRVRIDDLPFFLGLMDHLAANNVPAPVPIAGKNGKYLKFLAGKPAAIVSFLDGRSPTRPTPGHCHALGEILGKLHLAGRDFPIKRHNDLSLSGWQRLFDSCSSNPGVDKELIKEIEISLKYLEEKWPDHLDTGIIHADLFPNNIFYDGNKVTGVIDFYFACSDILAYDLAICLNAWCFERNKEFNVTKATMLFKGYKSIRPLSTDELEAIPVLCRGAALRFLLTRLYDWLHQVEGALVKPLDPAEYVAILRFHASHADLGSYSFTV